MNNKRQQGFLLLEVMISLAILTGALLVVLHAFRLALRMAQTSRQTYQAALLMEDRIGVLEKSGNSALDPFEDPILGPVSWQLEILPGSDSSWHLEQFILTWGDGRHAQSLELSTPIHD